MTDTAVTPFPGVTRRPDSAVWWFVLRAPQDLLHRFDGKPWATSHSLKTYDLREANAKARLLQSEWAQRFDAMRREDNPQRVELNPALVATIAAELRRWLLQILATPGSTHLALGIGCSPFVTHAMIAPVLSFS